MQRQLDLVQHPFEMICITCSHETACEIKRDWFAGKYEYLSVCNRKVAAEIARSTAHNVPERSHRGEIKYFVKISRPLF